MTAPDPLMTVHEVAKFFQVKPSTVRRWLRDGKIKAIKVNNYYRIKTSAVHEFAQETYGEK